MAETSKIEWTDATFNPWLGCTKVSPACAHCYAETWAKRSGLVEWGPTAERRLTSESYWRQPIKWNKQAEKAGTRLRVFGGSLCDWLDDTVPLRWFVEYLRLIWKCPHINWQLLTKRPENFIARIRQAANFVEHDDPDFCAQLTAWSFGGFIPDNMWIGVTVENQEWADKRIPTLLEIPARVRFLSCEPLLGPLDLSAYLVRRFKVTDDLLDAPDGSEVDGMIRVADTWERRARIHWIIAGGESGSRARPMCPGWVRSLQEQCEATRTSFFFKQWGEYRPGHIGEPHTVVDSQLGYRSAVVKVGKYTAGRLLDGVEYSEFPK